MAGTQVQRRRGTTAEHASFTGALGEITVDTTKKTAVVHDGTTAGGVPLAKETGSSISVTSLNISGTAARITGDFSNATLANRVMFQTSTTNAGSIIGAIPNGTASTARWQAMSGPSTDPNNASTIELIANGTTDVQINANRTGTGTYLPMTFYAGGAERVRIDTSGNVGIGLSSGISDPLDIQASSAARSINIRGRAADGIAVIRFADNSNAETARIDVRPNQIIISPVSSSSPVLCTGGGLGYGTGAGGTVTQATSKSTAVTLNKPTGQITMHNAALAAGASVVFSLNSTNITSGDVAIVNIVGGVVTAASYRVEVQITFVGTTNIRLTNISGGSLSEAVVLQYVIFKGETS